MIILNKYTPNLVSLVGAAQKFLLALALSLCLSSGANAGINKLPRFHAGISLGTMSGSGLSVQGDFTRFLSLKATVGGYYSDFTPDDLSIDRSYFERLQNDYLTPGFELQLSIDRSDKRKLFGFYGFSYWDFSQIKNFELTIFNDQPQVSYDLRHGISRNHAIGIGYEYIFDTQFVLSASLGYQYQYSTISGGNSYGWLMDRSPHGSVNHGLGFGFAVAYVID